MILNDNFIGLFFVYIVNCDKVYLFYELLVIFLYIK